MFDRPQSGTRAVLVHVDFRSDRREESGSEFHQLALSAGVEPVARLTAHRYRPDPKFLIGTGKADEVRDCVERHTADLVLVNHSLTPVQERNLERHFACRVVDRTALILDIFAQRASSSEGKLQVELAQLEHLATRLVRGWVHLERQKGGIGLRGPGETQLETDRRLIGQKIKQLNKRLAKLCKQRELRRQSRRKAAVTTVSMVGYTNAGKSTLFNRMTGAGVYAANQLFATLDPTLRRIELPGAGSVVLADTVGFIRQLPHDLVAAFRATLEETVQAGLLLHVIDASDAAHLEQIDHVNEVLSEIGAGNVAQLEVYNKIDLVDGAEPRVDRDPTGRPRRVWLSACNGAGIDLLRAAVDECLWRDRGEGTYLDTSPIDGGHGTAPRYRVHIKENGGRLRAQLFAWKAVVDESLDNNGDWVMDVILSPSMLQFVRAQPNSSVTEVEPMVGRSGCGDVGGNLKSASG